MKKVVRLTETELTNILKRIINENQILIEQSFLSKFLGSAGDDLIRTFGKESVESFSTLLSRSLNSRTLSTFKNGKQYLKSASGSELDVDHIEIILKKVSNGDMSVEKASTYLPRQLADGTNFRDVFLNSFKTKVNNKYGQAASSSAYAKSLPSWVSSKWLVTTNTNSNIAKLFEKLHKLKNYRFNPSDVKVTNTANLYDREVLELKLPTGDNVLLYKSTGTGAPELKQAGDWQLINGFVPSPVNPDEIQWFIKNEETTQLTKGLNKYATDLANFVKSNGWESLGN